MTNQHQGFTLVETLVAITILLIGVLGPLNIAARGIADGLYARNQISANYLAQEAIELIINKRNANISGDNLGWLDGITSAPYIGDYAVDPATGIIYDQCNPPGAIYPLGVTDYCNITLSGVTFTRHVNFNLITPTEIKVTVTISWQNKALPQSFTLTENLYRNQAI